MSCTKPILVIEDDDATRDIMVELLQSLGYAARGAANGKEGLRELQQGPVPCVILLDLMMPVMNGEEFRRHQLRNPDHASVPVIVVSARSEGLPATVSANGYIRKPVNIEHLLTVVEQHC